LFHLKQSYILFQIKKLFSDLPDYRLDYAAEKETNTLQPQAAKYYGTGTTCSELPR